MTYVRRRAKHFVIQERIHYHCELDTCPACGTGLVPCRHYRWAKPVQQLDRVVYVTNRPKRCPNPACAATTYGSTVAQTIALPNSSYGLDVIAQLGWWRDHEQLSGAQLHARLQGRVQIARRTANLLLQQYRLLLASAEQLKRPHLAVAVQTHGGLILSLDGLEPEGAQEQHDEFFTVSNIIERVTEWQGCSVERPNAPLHSPRHPVWKRHVCFSLLHGLVPSSPSGQQPNA